MNLVNSFDYTSHPNTNRMKQVFLLFCTALRQKSDVYYVKKFLQSKNLVKRIKNTAMWFEKFLPKLPVVKADDDAELEDPQQVLREKCRETDHCKHLTEKYEECNNRVNSRSHTTETCVEELMDLLHAVDHCVTKDLFSKLK